MPDPLSAHSSRPSSASKWAGARVLVLNWRDVDHPQAGGAEQYMHQISRRWLDEGVDVSWLAGRGAAQAPEALIDGIKIIRTGGPLSLYPRAAWKLLNSRDDFDAIIDCQNGIPFFSPLFVRSNMPIVQVVHHVHQDQFSTRFSRPLAAVGRWLEGTAARHVYGSRATVAVSPSTRHDLRRRLGFPGPIFVVPNGTIDLPTAVGPRDPDPTIAVVTRLVPHKRVDLLLGEVAAVAQRIPRLRVDIVGDGPERLRLQQLVVDLTLQSTVTFHGYQPNEVRDGFLRRSWLTTSTSAAEGWGCSVIEAAAWGVPCVALEVAGIRDSVLDGQTGWLVNSTRRFGEALLAALTELADEQRAQRFSAACRAWARSFTWDRSAELLAVVLLGERGAMRRHRTVADRRGARSDIGTFARFATPMDIDVRSALRATDEVVEQGDVVSVVLNGCDEFDAAAVMRRIGVFDAELRLVFRHLLTGPAGVPLPSTDEDPLEISAAGIG